MGYSILLRGGMVIDGSGAERFCADVAISGDRIAAVGAGLSGEGDTVLDCGGLVVAPGFIDCHSHSDLDLLHDPAATAKVSQGVTTEIVGNCGMSVFPVLNEDCRQAIAALLPRPGVPAILFASLAAYRAALAQERTAVNVASHVGHADARLSVIGGEDRPASESEMAAMCQLVEEGMRAGAAGISFGLLYAPGCFTPASEMVALGRVAARFGRPLVFHVRNETNQFLESYGEAIGIGRESGAAVHLSHLKVADPAHWGESGRLLSLLDEARDRGQAVTCDQYPYTAGSAPFQTLMPPWSLSGGPEAMLFRLADPAARARIMRNLAGKEEVPGWDNMGFRIGWERITIGFAPGLREWEGRSVADVAGEQNSVPAEVLFRLLLASRGAAFGIYHQMSEEDVRTIMVHPAQMVGSDGLPIAGKPHPRFWGTFPRVLGHYSRELGLLSLEEAVHRMTGKPARTFGLTDRGFIRAGGYADLCIFDPAQVCDLATYDEPTRAPEGIVHVICNGRPLVLDGSRTEERPGVFVAPDDA